MSRVPLSVIVPVKNEAANLPRCLASVAWADEVFVVDSQSTDGSQAIAEQHGAKVVQFHFNGTWPKKKNWALENLPFKHEWVFILDADEVIPDELQDEILALIANDQPVRGAVLWNQVAFGRPLTARKSTARFVRLFRTDTVLRFEAVVHEGAVLQPATLPVVALRHRLLHYSRESVYESILKLAQYVQLGAAKRAAAGKTGGVLREQ